MEFLIFAKKTKKKQENIFYIIILLKKNTLKPRDVSDYDVLR